MKNSSIYILFLTLIGTISLPAQTTWQQIPLDTDLNLTCIDFISAEVGYIAGDQILLKTSDAGSTWQEVAVGAIETLNNQDWKATDIQFFTELHGRMVLGEWQGMVETFDGGLTWTSMTPASSGFCRFGSIYYFDADHGLAGGAGCFESAIIDKFDTDSWSTTTVPSAADWDGTNDLVRNMDFFDLDNGLACTDGGRILRTTDGGVNWDSIPHPQAEVQFTDVAYLTADSVYASYILLGGFGTYISIDGGLSWDLDWETATFYYPSMYAAHVNGNGTPFFGGLNGNDQTTGVIFDKPVEFWNYQSIEQPIHDIDSHSDSITFLVGDSGAVYVNINPLLLGLDELNPTVQLHVYPNPATDWINISVNARANEVQDVRLFDMSGKEIDIDFTSTDYGIPVMLSDIPVGQYLIEVRTNEGRNTLTFQKE